MALYKFKYYYYIEWLMQFAITE